ncbi:MAG: ATP-binding protein [Gemmatimonadetes bacterium]|nr:ATP-binding protein [Gemmatimonadota bacterium]
MIARLGAENPWWRTAAISAQIERWPPRAYLQLFLPLVRLTDLRRAVVLMGPRRVGKTFLLHHTISKLLTDGVHPGSIAYISVDHPLYTGLSLEDLVAHVEQAVPVAPNGLSHIFFDEIQYLRDWEVHLKVLVDSRPDVKFIASGSAAAALKLKSQESGAGRFTNFMLPPLTFYEYIVLLGLESRFGGFDDPFGEIPAGIGALNMRFVDYLNFGGYPELALSSEIRADPSRFVKSDIVDKVLLRDLPSLYGISDIQELNYLFTTLAFNTAQEVAPARLAENSGVASPTIKKYIDYLEAAFLIKVVHKLKRNARRFQRARTFKVYLTNPSMRAALFAAVEEDSQLMGALAETAIFAQWFHADYDTHLHYARWQSGEVDIVQLDHDQKPLWAAEVKWSDRPVKHPGELRSLLTFAQEHGLASVLCTTRTRSLRVRHGTGIELRFLPASVWAYVLGRNIIANKGGLSAHVLEPS